MIRRRYITATGLGSCVLIWWGGFVANPLVDSFENYPVIFKPMQSIAPELFWGSIYLFCGLISLAFVRSRKPQSAAVINWLALTSIGVLFFLGDYKTFAWGIYLTIAVFNFTEWRLMRWTLTR